MERRVHEVGARGAGVSSGADVDDLLRHDEREAGAYIDAVVELAEQSERNYRAAVMAGQIVNGVTNSTNY